MVLTLRGTSNHAGPLHDTDEEAEVQEAHSTGHNQDLSPSPMPPRLLF